jgi:hypothetical protein
MSNMLGWTANAASAHHFKMLVLLLGTKDQQQHACASEIFH